jgi:hypothetical protein
MAPMAECAELQKLCALPAAIIAALIFMVRRCDLRSRESHFYSLLRRYVDFASNGSRDVSALPFRVRVVVHQQRPFDLEMTISALYDFGSAFPREAQQLFGAHLFLRFL